MEKQNQPIFIDFGFLNIKVLELLKLININYELYHICRRNRHCMFSIA